MAVAIITPIWRYAWQCEYGCLAHRNWDFGKALCRYWQNIMLRLSKINFIQSLICFTDIICNSKLTRFWWNWKLLLDWPILTLFFQHYLKIFFGLVSPDFPKHFWYVYYPSKFCQNNPKFTHQKFVISKQVFRLLKSYFG